jgi:regulator of protease activity HflC (stomatin/prohibitin superfamily)
LSAIAIIRIRDPRKALETNSEGYYSAIYRTLQLALRDIAAGSSLEDLLDQRDKLDERLLVRARPGCEEQGCELLRCNVRDVMMPAEIRRIATETVRAKLEAAASLERARGEQAALRALNNAARLLKGNPQFDEPARASSTIGHERQIGADPDSIRRRRYFARAIGSSRRCCKRGVLSS